MIEHSPPAVHCGMPGMCHPPHHFSSSRLVAKTGGLSGPQWAAMHEWCLVSRSQMQLSQDLLVSKVVCQLVKIQPLLWYSHPLFSSPPQSVFLYQGMEENQWRLVGIKWVCTRVGAPCQTTAWSNHFNWPHGWSSPGYSIHPQMKLS